MNEVEKMYENAGIDYEERYDNCTLNKEAECELKCSCYTCKYSEEKYIYPPFTAEKQLELIKWLFNSICLLNLGRLQFSENFENDLAGLINELWQDMSEEEEQQIKEILE